MKPPPLVEVRWTDAWSDDDPGEFPERWADRCPVVTVGFLVRRTPALVFVAGERVEHPTTGVRYRAVTAIPRVLVRAIRRLS
ncbi:MAG TPA: hypothetical protein VNO79_08280 [Actinomycetota bacterium]|nr:hypothetical protein [Actinomycetota bacterium]